MSDVTTGGSGQQQTQYDQQQQQQQCRPHWLTYAASHHCPIMRQIAFDASGPRCRRQRHAQAFLKQVWSKHPRRARAAD